MGGIAGFVGMGNKPLLRKMSTSLHHDGPQVHARTFIDDHATLVSQSSDSCIGLGENEDGTITVAFDGEVLNSLAIKNALNSDGHSFASPCKAELVAHLYEKYGVSCPKEIRGSFAFALWDSSKQQLHLARDTNGQKSMFYAQVEEAFLFASEIKALLCCENIVKKLSFEGLEYFFSWGHVPAPNTLFDDIKKVPASCLLTYENKRKTINSAHRYWTLDYSEIENALDEDAWCRRIYDGLVDSIRIRLGKGALGVLLGGLDSSVVASLARRLTVEPIKSFTVRFEEEEFNEPYVENIAGWLAIDAYMQILSARDFIHILPDLVDVFGDLKADIAPSIPTFLALKMAKEHVKTVLTGDHADCAFWSWGWTNPKAWTRKFVSKLLQGRLSEKVRAPILHLSRKYVLPIIKHGNSHGGAKGAVRNLHQAVRLAGLPSELETVLLHRYYHEDELQELLGFRSITNTYRPFLGCIKSQTSGLQSRLNRMHLINKEFEVIGGWGLSRLGDICARFSMEAQVPFADHKFNETTAKIPLYLKQPDEATDKYIFRKTIRKYALLPKEVANQRKWGFGWGLNTLMPKWFKGELRDYAEQTISEGAKRTKPILREEVVMKYLRKGSALQILTLLMFMLWHKKYFQQTS